jgi:hypothetical protein
LGVIAMMSTQTLDTTAVVIALLALFAMTAIAIKMYDGRRKREDEALVMQARTSDVLLAEPRLSGLSITPTVRVSRWPKSRMTVEITGPVPRPELREVAVELVIGVMSDYCGTDFRIEDRIVVDPFMSNKRAA